MVSSCFLNVKRSGNHNWHARQPLIGILRSSSETSRFKHEKTGCREAPVLLSATLRALPKCGADNESASSRTSIEMIEATFSSKSVVSQRSWIAKLTLRAAVTNPPKLLLQPR